MNEDKMVQDGADLNTDCNPLIAIMKRKTLGSLESIPSTVGASFQHILTEYCQDDLSRRPRAIDLVNAFHQYLQSVLSKTILPSNKIKYMFSVDKVERAIDLENSVTTSL